MEWEALMSAIDLLNRYVKLPPYINELHYYQLEDINRLAPAKSCGLFHEMGLGKSIMAILIGCFQIITDRHKQVIVLLPETLLTQWSQVLTYMELEHVVYRGTPKQRSEMRLDRDFILLSYQIFQKDYERLKEVKAFYIVDEATVFCNTSNLLYKMINGGVVEKKIEETLGKTGIKKPKKAHITYNKLNDGVCLLAGIPVIKPEDWYGMIQTINPGIYESRAQFDRLHIKGYDRFNRPDEYLNMGLLKKNAAIHTSSRLMSEVGIVLPPLVTKVVKYDLASDHMKLYKKLLHEKYLETKEGVIDALHISRLYNWAQRIVLCPERADYSKEPVGFELLDTLLRNQRHFLVFARYVDSNKKIMSRYNIGAIFGEVTSNQRQEYIRQFKVGELDGLTIHPKSGGFGLDLPEAKYIYFMELPMTPRDYFQSIARAYRQGQKDRVVVTIPYAAGTVQETLFRNIQKSCDDMSDITKLSRSLSSDFKQDVKTKAQVFAELEGKVVDKVTQI
jgi:SNF2 family DNA or RNA helicase